MLSDIANFMMLSVWHLAFAALEFRGRCVVEDKVVEFTRKQVTMWSSTGQGRRSSLYLIFWHMQNVSY